VTSYSSAITSSFLTLLVFTASAQTLPDPKLTEVWDPIPPIVNAAPVPSDAIVLFDGNDLENWQHSDGSAAAWTLSGGVMTVKPGSKGIRSKDVFCDIQLHLEWRTPEVIKGMSGQMMGNSGVFLQGRYEIQVLNSFENQTYSNGQAGSIYKQSIPLVNASKPPMQWQEYDIVYRSPKFDAKGKLLKKAIVTVFHNGVLIQDHVEIQGPTVFRGQPEYKQAHGCAPIFLQDHGDRVSYRNIWARNL